MKTVYFLLLPLLLLACAESVGVDYHERFEQPRELDFDLVQRCDTTIFFWGEKIFFYIDDISGGQTRLIVRKDKITVLDQYIFPKTSYGFSVHSKNYRLMCRELENFLIGYDVAHFTLVKLDGPDEIKNFEQKEEARIYELLELIKTADVEFIRNGESYNGEQAYIHLKGKYERSKSKIKTVDRFIHEIGSRSSLSGRDYLVRLHHGKAIPCADWLKELKKELD